MAEPNASAALTALDQQRNLRQLQEEALESLYVATSLAGLGLIGLGIQFPEAWGVFWVGYPLLFLSDPAYRLLGGRYLLRAWLLVGLWLGGLLAALAWLPEIAHSAPSLLALPVALAALLIGTPAGALTGLVATLAIGVAARGGAALPIVGTASALALLWGMLALIWLALRPMHGALGWSWSRYEQARRQVEQARDTQADLKQALKDLAEAGAQAVRLNQFLSAARRVAEEAERAKAEFVATVSHELRTPLNMIIGFSEMMLSTPEAYGRILRALQADLAVILRNSQHLSSLIDDVLDLSQIEACHMALSKEWVALDEIIEAAVEAIRPLFASKHLYLATELPEGLAVFGARTRLREGFSTF